MLNRGSDHDTKHVEGSSPRNVLVVDWTSTQVAQQPPGSIELCNQSLNIAIWNSNIQSINQSNEWIKHM
jgi:hypothetical protein